MLSILNRFQKVEHAAIYSYLDYLLKNKLASQKKFIVNYGSTGSVTGYTVC